MHKWIKYRVVVSLATIVAIIAIATFFDLWHGYKKGSNTLAAWTCFILYFIQSIPYAIKVLPDPGKG